MNRTRWAAVAAVSIAAALGIVFIAGCGGGNNGAKTHTLVSPWDGTLTGVDTEPIDGETNIAVDSWLHVFWPDENFPPPAQFTFRLEKEENVDEWGGIHTRLRSDYSDARGGSWWFEPANLFSRNTWYRIVLTDPAEPGRVEIFMFRTTDQLSLSTRSLDAAPASAGTKYRPEGAENAPPLEGEGAIDHVITTRS